jgi:hypothetical protein
MGKQAQRPPELYRIILPVKDIKKASIFYSKLLDLNGKILCTVGGICTQSNTFISLLRISIAPLRKQRICDASA